MPSTYTQIKLDIADRIGVVTLNRPHVLNAWNDKMLTEMVTAFRELDQHPETVFTALTGEGRFFSAGADIREGLSTPPEPSTPAQKKLFYMRKFSTEMELFRLLIDHTKILVLAFNGPGVGGGAAWFTGLADIVLASANSYLQVPFNSLGLVPEFGCARTFSQSMGVRRANEFLMFGSKCSVEELEGWGVVNRVFDPDGFQESVRGFLKAQLDVNDGGSMLETKRLQNGPLRSERIVSMFDAASALAERFVEGVPMERFKRKNEELARTRETRSKEKASL